MKTLPGLLLATVALLPAAVARADVAATVTKARAYIANEAALEALRSVHFVGTLETIEATPEGPRPMQARLEIIFQKPSRQRIMVTMDSRIEVTALDDYEGWQRIEDPEDASRWRLSLLSKEQVRRLRANTWENLAFFRGLEGRGGRIDDLGFVTVAEVKTHKLGFVHARDIIFYRYFAVDDGRLVLTETEQGGRIREEGEIQVEGIRFPAKIITTSKLSDGSEREVTVSFEKITVNESFPDSLFAVPAVSAR